MRIIIYLCDDVFICETIVLLLVAPVIVMIILTVLHVVYACTTLVGTKHMIE